MSADAGLIEALGTTTEGKAEFRYVELVNLKMEYGGLLGGGIAPGLRERRAYVCVGEHALVLMRPSLTSMVSGGEIEYQWIDQIVEDTSSKTDFLVSLTYGRPPGCPESVLVTSETRVSLLIHISICFLADSMHRLGVVVPFPKSEGELAASAQPGIILPFNGYKYVPIGDYGFFLREEAEVVPSVSSSSSRIVNYKLPATSVLGASPIRSAQDTIEISLHAYDPVPLQQLTKHGREHIRWVANEYKQALVKSLHTYCILNQLYNKKMNLANDPAAWICWELLLSDKDFTIVVVLLRRLYVPPLCDCAQDFAIVFKCPAGVIKERINGHRTVKDLRLDLLHQAHLAADTFSARAPNMTINVDVLQAKLDALLFDDESYRWIRSRLKMKPDGILRLEKMAFIFVRGILKILRDESALSNPEIWDEASRRVAAVSANQGESDLDPTVVAYQILRYPVEGYHPPNSSDHIDHQTRCCFNAWHARVAQYLSYCTDGGMIGNMFTLADIVSNLAKDKLSSVASDKLAEVLVFLLHLRSTDLKKVWEPKTLVNQLAAFGMLGYAPAAGRSQTAEADERCLPCTFNDRVMQALLEMQYFQKILPPKPGEGSISLESANLLKNLLRSESASISLKASICRQIIATKDPENASILCLGLIDLMRSGGIFLATYACAALVNLSQAKEVVKNYLMDKGVAEICFQQLNSKDDNLILYTLMLLVHLSKLVHHRDRLKQCGLVPVLYDILAGSREDTLTVLQLKRRQLTEVCSVLGQMCNDDETRTEVWGMGPPGHVLQCLLTLFDTAKKGNGNGMGKDKENGALPVESCQILSKVCFALKQISALSMETKEIVGKHVIQDIVVALGNSQNLQQKDWATNAIMLLLLLAINRNNCLLIESAGWSDAFKVCMTSPLGKADATRDRLMQIQDRTEETFEVLNVQQQE